MIQTKRCSKCKQVKEVTEFHKDARTKQDGLYGHCKKCHNVYTKQYNNSKNGIIACQRYRDSKKGKQTKNKYRNSAKGKHVHNESEKRFRQRYPEKAKAKNRTVWAVVSGKIPRIYTLKCVYCSKQAQHYHHPDYSKPLWVFPVCIICHKKIHLRASDLQANHKR